MLAFFSHCLPCSRVTISKGRHLPKTEKEMERMLGGGAIQARNRHSKES